MKDNKFISDIKRFWNKDRFKTMGRYIFDRRIFQTGMFIIFATLFLVAYHYDFSMDYYSCHNPSDPMLGCHNPFYKASTWKNIQYLPEGDYGTNPSPILTFLYVFVAAIFLIAIALNHLAHNHKPKIS